MTKQRAGNDRVRSALVLLRWAYTALVFCPLSHGQSGAAVYPSPLAFEVASVKQVDLAKPRMGKSFGPDENGMRLVSNLGFYIELAYGLEGVQIKGLPAWTNGQFYEIAAKTKAPSKPAEVEEMLRSLLQDRFKLVSHFETNTGPIYSLTIGKGGLKINPVSPDDQSSYSAGPMSLRGVLTTSQIADQLTAYLQRTVVDNTGLNQRYRIDLKWIPDVQTQKGDEAPDGVSIFTAIQEQLGMKLQSTKGLVRTLVIDHVERPSVN